MKFGMSAVAAVTMLCAVLAAPVQAAEEAAIDCSSTPFVFSGDGYFIDCVRYEAKPRKDGASGESQSDVINVTSDERVMFLTLVSIRLTSTGLHMRYQNLRENTRDFFSGVELKDWNGIGYQGGYDTAEFTSEISGSPPAASPSSATSTRPIAGSSATSSAWAAPPAAWTWSTARCSSCGRRGIRQGSVGMTGIRVSEGLRRCCF